MIVIYLPVKFEFDWKSISELESGNGNVDGQRRGNCTNCESNLALMVIYLPVEFEFDWTKHFRVTVQKRKRRWPNKQKNGQTNRRNYINFESNLVMKVIYLPAKLKFNWTKRFQVGVQKQLEDRSQKKKIMFLHSKNKASRKGYKGEC